MKGNMMGRTLGFRGACLLAWAAFGLAGWHVPARATAQEPPVTAVDADFVRAVYAHWYLPRASEFAGQGAQLTAAIDTHCHAGAASTSQTLQASRQQWQRTVGAWERLSAVRGGALLARRSPREIDFTPTRPEAILRAVHSAPADAHAMESVGSPAKGLPALEWLLWNQPLAVQSAECRYAYQVAVGIGAEGVALQQAYSQALGHGWDAQELEYAVYEFLNLFDAGIQKLWWEDMNRPQQKAATGSKPAAFARSLSGSTVQAWGIHWKALRSLALGDAADPSAASLDAFLRTKSHVQEARRLTALVADVDQAMALLENQKDAPSLNLRIGEAVVALKALQNFVENDMANALQFIISFFDEDGD